MDWIQTLTIITPIICGLWAISNRIETITSNMKDDMNRLDNRHREDINNHRADMKNIDEKWERLFEKYLSK
jgi:hypothetical protein